MTISLNGFDELASKLNNLQTEIKNIEKGINVSFDELFTRSFMCKHTNSTNINDFLVSGGFSVKSKSDFEAIPDEELNSYVRSNSSFDTWKDMLTAATNLYIANKLKL